MDRLCSTLRLLEWRRDRKNSRRGFVRVELPTACGPLTIDDVVVSENCGSRFVGLPAFGYITGGVAKYKNILKFHDIAVFRAAAIALVEKRDPGAFDEPTLGESGEYRETISPDAPGFDQ